MSWREQAPCWPDNWARIERITHEPISAKMWIPLTPDAGWKHLAKGRQICKRFCDSIAECGEEGVDRVGVWAGEVRGMVRPELRRGK